MEFGGLYGFQYLPTVKFPSLDKPLIQEALTKWAMKDGLRVQAYSFTRPFRGYLHEEFIKDFFACPAVTSTLSVGSAGNNEVTIIGTPAESIKYSELKCTSTTMELFDELLHENYGITRTSTNSGEIVKCIPKYFRCPLKQEDDEGPIPEGPEFLEIADNLRKLVIYTLYPQEFRDQFDPDDDDDQEELFIETLKKITSEEEFLYHLFSHFVLGGSLCQYEVRVQPYLEVTKMIYKELVGVVASDSESGDHSSSGPKIVTLVYRIHSVSNFLTEGNLLFHKEHFNNFCYLLVNPIKQNCLVLYHQM